MPEITVSDIVVDIVRKDVKNLHLSLLPPVGKVRITAPLNIDDDAIRIFAVSKLSWIKKNQIKFKEQERLSEREYVSGESHYYQGKRYLLSVIYHEGIPKVELRNKSYFDLYVSKSAGIDVRKSVLNKWYRAQLKEEIQPLITKWQEIMNISNIHFQIKQMKTKWGSCNREEHRIWINLDLIKKPPHCLEYVIVHEMTHFLERSHNERFIAYMDKFLPKWRAYKEELNQFVLEHATWSNHCT